MRVLHLKHKLITLLSLLCRYVCGVGVRSFCATLDKTSSTHLAEMKRSEVFELGD